MVLIIKRTTGKAIAQEVFPISKKAFSCTRSSCFDGKARVKSSENIHWIITASSPKHFIFL